MIFYLLVVWYPDKRQKNHIKGNLIDQWECFKERSIEIFLLSLNGEADWELCEKLKDQNEFRNYFKELDCKSQEKWAALWNPLEPQLFNDLLVSTELLLNEVQYVRNNVNIEDKDVYLFVQNLSEIVYQMRHTNPEDDDLKYLERFFWQLLAGWSPMEGYRKIDIVAVMIKNI